MALALAPLPCSGQEDELARLLAGGAPDPIATALAVARLVDPKVDGALVEKRLEEAAELLRRELATCGDDDARVAALTKAVHQTLRLAVEQDAAQEFATTNVLPHQVLGRGRGACLGLSLIYLSLGKRAGLDLRGVSLPGHFFVRFRGKQVLNLETTQEGLAHSDAWFRKRTGLPAEPDGPEGNYLRDLEPREIAAEVLNSVGGEWVREGKAGRAVPFLRRACRLAPSDADAHYNLAHAFRESGRRRDALDSVERSLVLFRSKEASNLRGLLHLESQRPDLAAEDFSAALRLDPQEARYWNNRGSARCFMGFLEKGVADFDEALRLRPGWGQALCNRGLARLEQGQVAGAAKDFKLAQADGASWRELFGRLPETAEAGRSLRDLAQALEGDRSVAVAALFAAGDRLLAVKEHREARAVYDRVLRLGGDSVEAYCKRGLACEGLGDELWAKRNYYLATQANGRDPLGFKYMANYYLRRDRYAVAVDYFRKYLERASKDAHDRDEVEALVKEIEGALGQ